MSKGWYLGQRVSGRRVTRHANKSTNHQSISYCHNRVLFCLRLAFAWLLQCEVLPAGKKKYRNRMDLWEMGDTVAAFFLIR